MFGIGTGELLLILVIALIVLGPERMPRMARDIGRVVGELRRTSDELRDEFMNADKAINKAIDVTASQSPAQPLPAAAHASEPAPPAGQSATDYNERARKVIDRRINGLGVSEPVIQAIGDDKILLQLPGIDDIQQANDIATRQAKLEIKVPDKENAGKFKSLT